MPQAGLLGTIHHADGTEDIPRNFEGPQVLVPEQTLKWLRDKLPNPIDRSEARRQEANKFFFALVREGIANALVHRDYSIAGAKCQLIVTPDTIVIKSPGKPVAPITIEQLQAFNAPMLSRNPTLHYVFGKLELAEERGLGLKTMQESAAQAGLPLPKYSWEDPYLVLTLYRNAESAVRGLSPEALAGLNKDEKASWQFVTKRESISRSELMEQMGFDERKAQRVLKRLREAGLLDPIGKGRVTSYKVVRQ
jgi:ATP-dependent DNA helicase RecG